ncbi:MAG: PIN domain-containing protein [Candidatus Bathyarchaeota archaeon]|nr:PIN domain-containing protein [Candidatus Bathyarchaeota archaeon]
MPNSRLYDTRFFVESFYTSDSQLAKKLREEFKLMNERLVSSLTIHEIYRIVIKKEGKVVATLRSSIIRRDFQVIDVDYQIATKSAELRNNHPMPMADSVIAATSLIEGCSLFTDDAHFKNIENLKTVWCSR